ncbi:MAG: PH domain-containing protein [Sporolactobacillus sp.]|nr:PH domain-containing protein [Sporolactobacillus sp.]
MEKKHLDRGVVVIWRQRSLIFNAILWLIDGGLFFCTWFFHWAYFMYAASGGLAALTLLHLILFVVIFPPIRYRTFFYAIRPEDLLIQGGILVISQTIIPLPRVQNVETEQGPLLRRRGLTSVSITTAADTHEIPALAEREALFLRDQISQLIKENAVNEI